MKLSKTKHFVYVTMLAAMAIAINLLETMLTVSLPFGMRLGLANIIALITIEILGVKEMIIVNTMRVVIGNLLRGTIFGSTFWISAGGVILSSIVLIIIKKGLKMSMISTSMLCAIGHSVGQVVIVMVPVSYTHLAGGCNPCAAIAAHHPVEAGSPPTCKYRR